MNRADVCERVLALAQELRGQGEMADSVAGILFCTGSAIIDDEIDSWSTYCGIWAMAKVYRRQQEPTE